MVLPLAKLLISYHLVTSISLPPGTLLNADETRLALERCSASWFGRVTISGYIVALGCLLEAPETYITIKKWWMLRFKDVEIDETREEKRSLLKLIGALGLALIVVGIVFETYYEGKVSDVDSQLRAHESEKITAAEAEASSAATEAGKAKDSAILADDAAKRANDMGASAERKAAAANQLAGKAVHDASSASDSINDARRRFEQLVKQLAGNINPRHISYSQFAALMKGQPKGSIAIWYEPNDNEVRFIALQLKLALLQEHWCVSFNELRPPTAISDPASSHFDELRREADSTGMAMGSAPEPLPISPNSPQAALSDAITFATGGWNFAGLKEDMMFPELPADHFILIVGPHRLQLPDYADRP